MLDAIVWGYSIVIHVTILALCMIHATVSYNLLPEKYHYMCAVVKLVGVKEVS